MPQCRACGADVQASDRFCNTCGARLSGAPAVADAPEPATTPPADERGAAGPIEQSGEQDEQHDADDAPTRRVAPLPPPSPPTPRPAASAATPSAETRRSGPVVDDDADPDVTSQLAAMATGRSLDAGATTTRLEPATDDHGRRPERSDPADRPGRDEAAQATTTMPAAAPPRVAATTGSADSSTTVRSATLPPGVTGQVPATYTPYRATLGDRTRDDEGARFRLRLVLVAAIAAAGLAIATAMADIVSIEPSGGTPAFETGTWRLNDLGTNNTVAAAIAAALMLLGAALACFRVRFGAGLAAGAGLAVAGWAALMVGLAEIPLSSAGNLTGQAPPGLTVELTRDIGYWLLVAAGGAGVLVLLTSLTLARRHAGAGLNPWLAALGAAATLVAVAGPAIPEGDAELEWNWSSPVGQDLPTLYFAGRATQLGVLALTGVIGFLVVRRFGLGVAVGGFSIVTWLALTSLLDLTDNPIGPAVANPSIGGNFPFPVQASADELVPHAATIGGIAVALFCAIVIGVEAALTRRDT